MANEQKKDPRTVKLKMLRISFGDSLKDAKPTVQDGVPKHTSNFIVIKTPKAGDALDAEAAKYFESNKALIQQALEAAGEQGCKNKDIYKVIMEDNPKRVAYRRGERFKNKEGQVYQGYENNWAISAAGPSAGRKRPKMFDRNKRPYAGHATPKQIQDRFYFDDPNEVCYSGSYADVILSFYYTEKGGQGIFATIEAIRSYQKGERVGGGVYVDADDFDDEGFDMDADDAFDGTSEADNDPLG